MGCKEICLRYKANRPGSGMRYISGQKRCQICEIYLNWEKSLCPCCGYRLRNSPRRSKYKLINIKAKEIRINNIQYRK
jgi:hypothetical protein